MVTKRWTWQRAPPIPSNLHLWKSWPSVKWHHDLIFLPKSSYRTHHQSLQYTGTKIKQLLLRCASQCIDPAPNGLGTAHKIRTSQRQTRCTKYFTCVLFSLSWLAVVFSWACAVLLSASWPTSSCTEQKFSHAWDTDTSHITDTSIYSLTQS